MSKRHVALACHSTERKGKIKVVTTIPCANSQLDTLTTLNC